MSMKSCKIRLELNDRQNTLAAKHAGVARHAYNWGLAVCKTALENKEKLPSAIDLHKKLVAEVKTVHAWYYEVSKCAPQQALRNLSEAFKRCFRQKIAKFPVFKKKGQRDSIYVEGNITIKGNKIKLPKFGWVKMSETLPEQGVKNAVISRSADEWFISFKVPHTPVATVKTQGTVGVDLGIKTLATLSNGTTFDNPRPYKRYMRKLRLAQREMSKKHKKDTNVVGGTPTTAQSKNYEKAKQKVAKLHQKVGNIRRDALHKLTTYLAKNHSEVVIEDLNVRGMSKNRRLASAILDGGFYEFKRQLSYKTAWYGSILTIADRFFASSKTCSSCGHRKEKLALSEREYCCEQCGFQIDRDLNAAVNLRNKAASYAVSACGVPTQPTAAYLGGTVKQEVNNNLG